MNFEPLSIYYITINDYEKACELSKYLIDLKLIACCNIIGKNDSYITSIYSWEGKINIDNEILMICKSRTSLINEIIEEVKKKHPFEIPEIIATGIQGGNPDYIKWVLDNTKNP